MKVSTLIYIHKLLIEEETRKLLLKNVAYQEYNEAHKNDPDFEERSPEVEDLYKKYNEANIELDAAREARIDFEEKDW